MIPRFDVTNSETAGKAHQQARARLEQQQGVKSATEQALSSTTAEVPYQNESNAPMIEGLANQSEPNNFSSGNADYNAFAITELKWFFAGIEAAQTKVNYGTVYSNTLDFCIRNENNLQKLNNAEDIWKTDPRFFNCRGPLSIHHDLTSAGFVPGSYFSVWNEAKLNSSGFPVSIAQFETSLGKNVVTIFSVSNSEIKGVKIKSPAVIRVILEGGCLLSGDQDADKARIRNSWGECLHMSMGLSLIHYPDVQKKLNESLKTLLNAPNEPVKYGTKVDNVSFFIEMSCKEADQGRAKLTYRINFFSENLFKSYLPLVNQIF